MHSTKFKYLVGDFETTVYEGQTDTEVWASALVEMFTEDVKIFHSIEETFDYLKSLNCNICVYYHNLKFDGSFWVSYLMNILQFEQATDLPTTESHFSFLADKDMKNNTFKYLISDLGQWYSVTIKIKNHIIELRDSLKLLPFSVKVLGKSFKTKHQKLDMEYEGFRFAGCTITDDEKRYIANDVLVVKEALEIMFKEGHNKLTIGSCCLKEFKDGFYKKDYQLLFPDMYDYLIDPLLYNSENAGDYIRKSYKGGWCYLVRGKECKIFNQGTTADVNSLYPSMMSSESGNRYPIGEPTFWSGNYIPYEALMDNRYFFIRIRTKFYLKQNYLPCIQIKNNWLYRPREWLETSDIKNPHNNKYYSTYIDKDGTLKEAKPVLTLTMTDYYLIKEHYNLVDCEILDGCYFDSLTGLFDNYIEKYKKIKLENKGAKRELAKLFLNNLYGKLASSPNSSFKCAYIREDKSIGYYEITEFNKKAGYIPIGSAITSYARNFTIRAAQKNYYGRNNRGFIYADTDSIHCDLLPNEIKGITVHDKNFCCWKLESCWDIGYFVRQKTYIERVTHENLVPIADKYYNIKCAGMSERCKLLFEYSMLHLTEDEWQKYYPDVWAKFNAQEKEFVLTSRTIEDFKVGLIVPSKLMPKTIRGGTILVNTTYEMR